MSDNPQEAAVMHYGLTRAFLKQMRQANENCGDVFGVGEDDIVRELYCYASIAQRSVMAFQEQSTLWRDSAVYEFTHRLACWLWPLARQQGKLPCLKAFEKQTHWLLSCIQ